MEERRLGSCDSFSNVFRNPLVYGGLCRPIDRSARYVSHALQLVRAPCSPGRDGGTGLIQKPTNRKMSYALAVVLPSEFIEEADRFQIARFAERRKLRIDFTNIPSTNLVRA